MPTKPTRRPSRKEADRRHKQLDGSLANLTQAELIRSLASPEAEYIFKHALVQDTAQSSLLLHDRKRLHLQVAHAFEFLFAERCIDEYAAFLVGHYAAAGDDEKTLQYATIAGDQAFRVYALPEAITFYTQAIAAASRLPQTPSAALIHLYYQRGQAYYSHNDWREAWENYEEMERAARARQDRSLELSSLVERVLFRAFFSPLFEPSDAQRLAERALPLARELDDRAARSKILWGLMRVSAAEHDAASAIEYGQESLALARELGLREQTVYILGDLQYAYRGAARLTDALACLDEARARWRELGQQHMLADNLNQAADLHYISGDLARCEDAAREALTVSRQTSNPTQEVLGLIVLCRVAFERGEISNALALVVESRGLRAAWILGIYDSTLAPIYSALGAIHDAIELMESAVKEAQHTQLGVVFRDAFLAELTRLYLAAGQVTAAENTFAQIRMLDLSLDFAVFFGGELLPLARADLDAAGGEHAKAALRLEQALDEYKRVGLHIRLPEGYFMLGQARMAQADWVRAAAAFTAGMEIAAQMGSRRNFWRLLAALSEVNIKQGNLAAAEKFRAQARAEIEFIAARTPEAFTLDAAAPLKLRESFMNMPEVKIMMS